jgi:hypothetical protein
MMMNRQPSLVIVGVGPGLHPRSGLLTANGH